MALLVENLLLLLFVSHFTPNFVRNTIIIDKINTDIEIIYQLMDTQRKVTKQLFYTFFQYE